MKDLLHTFAQKVSQALSRAVYVFVREDTLYYFKFFLMGFQKFFLIWVAGTILEGWDAELETDPFMCI